MNGLSVILITFVVWISAKGELANYVKLARENNVDLKLAETPNVVSTLPQLKTR